MADLTLSAVTKRFGPVAVLADIDLQVSHGEFVVFVGPSGCGKSTLLRIIAGLENLTSGAIQIGGEDVSRRPPAERGIAMVFQTYALYPHKTVFDNMAYGLRLAKRPKAEVREAVMNVARILELEPYLGRKPAQLSGGQRQRVAIGRAIVRNPKVFLFDEPLSNLDAALRGQMRIEIADLHQRLNATIVYVTHDQVEAMTMADRIVMLNAGRVEQVGAPLELYHNPRNIFVAGFLGSPKMNFLPGTHVRAGEGGAAVDVPGVGVLELPVDDRGLVPGAPVTLGIRPHDIAVSSGEYRLEIQVGIVEPLGGETIVYGALESGGPRVTIALDGDSLVRPRTAATFHFDAANCHLFREDGTACRRRTTPAVLKKARATDHASSR